MTKLKINASLKKAEKLFESEKYKEAFNIYENLASKGVLIAQYRLADIYAEGYISGGESNIEEAAYWYGRAANQGDSVSQFNYAGFFCTGEGVEFSYAHAYFWYRRAFRKNNEGALEKLNEIKSTISKDKFKKCLYVVDGFKYASIKDSISAILKEWSSERKRDLIIYLNDIWTPKNSDITNERNKITGKDLTLIIDKVPPDLGYEIVADILEFEYIENQCVNDIEKLIELFTQISIQSKNNEDPIYGEDISIFKELKIAFDGYSEDEENLNNKSRSYVTYVHKNSADASFVFPEHEQTILGAMQRPGSEIHIYSWYDKKENKLEVINVYDHIKDDKMSAVNILNILIKLAHKYCLVAENKVGTSINKFDNFDKFKFIYTVLISTEYFDYERKGDKPCADDAKLSASIIYKLVNSSVESFLKMGRSIKEIYVGIYPNYLNLFRINLPVLIGKKSTKPSETKAVNDLLKVAKNELLDRWPDELERISLTIIFTDGKGIPTDRDMLEFSSMTDVDCEAMVRASGTGTLVIQGYECGNYDTGYISNDQDDVYLMANEYQKYFVDLQDPSIISERVIQ